MKIKELSEIEWGEFSIGEMFKLTPGKSKGLNHLSKNGTINYTGATNINNGVLSTVMCKENIISDGNCIAFIRNGEGSMGYSNYKEEKFVATSDITLGYNKHLNRYIGTYITTVSDKVTGKYNFGYKRSETRLKKEKILLSITVEGNPDWDYMENYMKKLEFEKLNKYLKK